MKVNCRPLIYLILLCSFMVPKPLLGKKNKGDDKKESKSETLLYKISMGENTERSKIYNYSKKRFKFTTGEFKEPVKKFSVFLVVNDSMDGVLAEIVVVKTKRRKKIAYAKKSRIVDNVKLIDLVGKTVIRLEDLGNVMGSVRTYRRNPLLDVQLIGGSSVLSSANVATGIDLTPQILTTGASLTIFAPRSSEIEWLNWLGFRYKLTKILESNIKIRTSKSNTVQDTIFSGERKNMEILFQPWFPDWWIYQFTFIYGMKQEKTEKMSFVDENSSTEDQITLTTQQSAGYFGMGLAFNPVHNLYGGLMMKSMGAQEYKVIDSSSEQEKVGKWGETRIGAWGAWVHAMSYELKFSMRFDIELRQDRISDSPEIGSGKDHIINDWERSVQLGVHYAP